MTVDGLGSYPPRVTLPLFVMQDVTWRYSSKHLEVLSRRTACSEDQLLSTMLRLRRARQASLSTVRQAYLEKRVLCELVEFLTAKDASDAKHGGRSSGSAAWRLARGEIGDAVSCVAYSILIRGDDKLLETVSLLNIFMPVSLKKRCLVFVYYLHKMLIYSGMLQQ